MRRTIVFLVVTFVAASCKPDLAVRESIVTSTRVLALRGEPAEAAPGASVTYSVLVASPEGPVTSPLASWAYCATPKRLIDNGVVSPACLSDGGVRAVASGVPSVTTPLPSDACALFGPEVSAAELRPRDPDVTGGYYQPMRVAVPGAETTVFGLERISCSLARAGAEIVTDFGKRYTANANPMLLPVEARVGGRSVDLAAIPRGARVTLRAAWAPEAAERYVALDVDAQRLVDRRESMRVSWYATSGAFANDRTGRDEDELESFTENDWTAPDEVRTTHLFVVLRDSRGGIGFDTYEMVTR